MALFKVLGYIVHGIVRRASNYNTQRIEHLYANRNTHQEEKMILHYGDMTDSSVLVKIISQTKPDEIYNLAAQSHVGISFDLAEYTADVDGTGTLRILDAIRTCGLQNKVKFYQASTSGKIIKRLNKLKSENLKVSDFSSDKKCLVKLLKFHRKKLPLFTPVVLTLQLKFMPTG